MPARVLRTPVLVAGAGVSGPLTALELARQGVRSIVVERAKGLSRLADPLLVSGRSMELLRRLGLAEAVRADGVDPDRAADIVWTQGHDQPPVLVWRLPSVTQLRLAYATIADGSAPIEPYLLIGGPKLVGRLRLALLEHPLVDLRTGWTLTDARAEPGGVITTVIDSESGTRHVIEADFLAGCDGAQSTVRRCVDLPLEALGPQVPHLTVYFRSAALASRRTGPSALITGGATLVCGHDGDACVAHLPLAPDGQVPVTDPGDLLMHRLGLRDTPEIQAVVQRDGAPCVARAYRRDRVFLAGQAAHQLEPPGDDIDTCIGDAVDLGWRLAAAVHGWAGEQLLAGYALERRRRALLDRELARRALQARRRFQRLVDSGADRATLVDVLRHEAPQLDPAGTGPPGMVGAPGFRPPAFRLTDGDQFFDRLGPQFTLVDLTHDLGGQQLVTAARARGIPIHHMSVAAATVPAVWSGRLLLVRPDQQVAWRSEGPPSDCDGVLDEVTGPIPRLYENT